MTLGDASNPEAAEHDVDPLPSYELPSGRRVLSPDELARRALDADAPGRLHATDAAPGATALLVRRLLARAASAVVVVTPSREAAQAARSDLELVLRPGPWSDEPLPAGVANATTLVLDAGDVSPYADLAPDRRTTQQRMATLLALASVPRPLVAIVPATTLARKIVRREVVLASALTLRRGEELELGALTRRLEEVGYLRTPLVEDPASFAVRGGLLDVWPAGATWPSRIELVGDTVAEMRLFDPDHQRSIGQATELRVPPATDAVRPAQRVAQAIARVRELCDAVDWPSTRARALCEELRLGRVFFGVDGFTPAFVPLGPCWEHLPDGALVVLEDPERTLGAITEELSRARADETAKRNEPHFPLAELFCEAAEAAAWLDARRVLSLHPTAVTGADPEAERLGWAGLVGPTPDAVSLATFDQSDLRKAVDSARAARGYRGSLTPLVRRIRAWQEAGLRVVVAARASSQAGRLALMLQNRGLRAVVGTDRMVPRAAVAIVVGALQRGVVAPLEGLCLVTEEEIFGSSAARRRARTPSPAGRSPSRALLSDLRDLAVGDFVVHTEHGIGRYLGLVHREVGAIRVDLLTVEYAGGDKLYLPVYRLNLVHKLRGSDGPPKLDRLGGQSFARSKGRAARKARQLADELLRLYAERSAAAGTATPGTDDEYRAFEATFPYEETDDQARAIAEVSADLEAARPMDRLVCGDVGFGKTEIALRAAFRVASSGRQVAVLCPTTVLAQQHLLTFEARLGAYPITIAGLSRFQSKSEQQRVVQGLRSGSVDVVIGTHRLLSKDVHFKALGLLVVDEEQRFGVQAKERIKALRTNVDVLTLTATPIPRTMQMAISGLRDLSIITTPPADRRAVRTILTRDDPKVLRDAIARELGRGGQIYFVHNRVQSLAERAAYVQQLAPQARIALAHGQMREATLERTMLGFVQGHYDVLCCTAIIENGLDIPRCNTIIVDRADRYGLAQLHQLRGRVGRARERAYCYLVVPTAQRMSDEARQRVEALQRHGELGSGFQLAALDLDLRGAGELLGADQSGTVGSVGFEMFCELLADAVHELRGEPVAHALEPELAFDVEALLPESYVADVGVRLSTYKRLAGAASADEVAELERELEDRFGPAPTEARRLLHLMSLKTELRRLRVLGCEATAQRVTLHLRDDAPIDARQLTPLLQLPGRPYRLTPDLRLSRTTRPGESVASGLEALERLLAEIAPACA